MEMTQISSGHLFVHFTSSLDLVALIGVLLPSSVKNPLKLTQPMEELHWLSCGKVQRTKNNRGASGLMRSSGLGDGGSIFSDPHPLTYHLFALLLCCDFS